MFSKTAIFYGCVKGIEEKRDCVLMCVRALETRHLYKLRGTFLVLISD